MTIKKTSKPKQRPRKNTIGVRLSDEELELLKAKSHGTTIASFLRATGLGDKTKPLRRLKLPPKVDPDFMRVFVGIANNINQLTRYAHLSKNANTLDVAELAYQLAQVKDNLEKIQSIAMFGVQNDNHNE